MKRTLAYCLSAAAIIFTASSCLKNNVQPPAAPQDPSLEAPGINSFISAQGFAMQEVMDSTTIVSNSPYGLYHQNVATPGLMYQIVDQGNMAPGSEKLPDSTMTG